MSVETICKFHKFGYCKFGLTCHKQHVTKVCESEACGISNCTSRHPSYCKYFERYKRCKFGEYCSFLHMENSDTKVKDDKVKLLENDTHNLKDRVNTLANILNLKEKDIENKKISLKHIMEKINSNS